PAPRGVRTSSAARHGGSRARCLPGCAPSVACASASWPSPTGSRSAALACARCHLARPVAPPPLPPPFPATDLPVEHLGDTMADAKTDLLQGTLDLLVLRTLAHGAMHGWGV